MNLAISAFLMSCLTFFVAFVFRDSALSFLNPDALIIVLGGSICALCIGFPFGKIRGTVNHVVETFTDQRERDALVGDLTGMARAQQRADIRSMERKIRAIKDDFLQFGLDLLINNHKEEDIRQSMEREMAVRLTHYHFSQNVLHTMARLTPAFGLVGTVLSLIRMFSTAQSFDALAPLMASALMSTLYGVVISNLFMLPLSVRVADRAASSEILMNITMEGILAMHGGQHPMMIEERFKGYAGLAETGAENNMVALTVRQA